MADLDKVGDVRIQSVDLGEGKWSLTLDGAGG